MKVLMLVISSNTYPVYAEHRKVWARYMHSNPNVDCVFLQFSPTLRFQSHTFDGETLTFPGVERYETIYLKTILALRYFLARKTYDYVVRTNLSCVWDFTTLLAYLDSCPRTRVYAGTVERLPHFSFVSGSGILWSVDVAHMLASNPGPHWKWTSQAYDDVMFGYWLDQLGIRPVPSTPWVVVLSLADYQARSAVPADAFHFRCKHIDNIHSRMEEPITMNRLLDEWILSKPIQVAQSRTEDPGHQTETPHEKEQND